MATRTHAHRPVRLDLAALQRWDPATHETLRGVVEDFVANGGTDPAATGPGWSWAALTDQQKVVAADQVSVDLFRRSSTSWHCTPCARELSAVTGLPAPVTIDDARHIVVNVTRTTPSRCTPPAARAAFDPSLPTEDLNRQVAALAGKAVRKDLSVKVGFFERRRIAAQVHAAYPNLSDPGSTLLLALKTRQMFERETERPPQPPFSAAAAALDMFTAVSAGLEQLPAFLQNLDPRGQDLGALVGELAGTLTRDPLHRRFPLLHAAANTLHQAGGSAFLADLRSDPPKDEKHAAARFSHAFALTVIEYIERTDTRLFGIDAGVRDGPAASTPPRTSPAAPPTSPA